ncbi:MAG TPA: manganese efflux pump, partial [Papillibacter sp.]|jgi:putative Mn2+ efflux pump MntP|nr:manganese efflux pump [Papillibacter sp.]
MSLFEVVVLAFGLAMDAVAVSICKGLGAVRLTWKNTVTVGAWFGGFQALMPTLGFFLGTTFAEYIRPFSGWIAFVLLVVIGVNMIREAVGGEGEEDHPAVCSFSARSMFLLAIATSIDALAVGVTFSFLNVEIFSAAAIIGVMTFVLAAIGVRIGHIFGKRFQKPAEITGGCILCLLGVKILLEHLGVL